MLGLIAVRVPIAFCMAFIGFFGIILAVGWPAGGEFDFQRGFDAAWAYIAFEPFSFIANFPIIAVPLFLMMGYVAFHAGFTKDIYYGAGLAVAVERRSCHGLRRGLRHVRRGQWLEPRNGGGDG